jgi:hypothetical protein
MMLGTCDSGVAAMIFDILVVTLSFKIRINLGVAAKILTV